jgi:signal peptidase I
MPEEPDRQNRQRAQQWLKLLAGSLRLDEVVELPVLSNSMLPVFGMGRHIKIRRETWKSCRSGDIIVFRVGRRLMAHRLLFVLRTGRGRYFFQKGDANPTGHFIRAERVVGRVIEYRDETGSYRSLCTRAARRTGRVEAFKQMLRIVWRTVRRVFGRMNRSV